jgi:hypothetical protein
LGRLKTNRDLREFVAKLLKTHEGGGRSLEEYLRSLWLMAKVHREGDAIELSEFASMLDRAFSANVPDFDHEWLELKAPAALTQQGFEEWENTVLFQISDLYRMVEDGEQEQEQEDGVRRMVVSRPDGGSWFNFDTVTFLERGVEGAFRGWESGEDTVRGFAPGAIAAPGEEDGTGSSESGDDEEVIFMPYITWSDFTRFLNAGQSSE